MMCPSEYRFLAESLVQRQHQSHFGLNGVPDRILTVETLILPFPSPTLWHNYLPLVMRSTS